MDLFLIMALLLSLTVVFGVINEHYLRLPSAIGLMFLALLMTLVLAGLKDIGVIHSLGWEETLVSELDLSNQLMITLATVMLGYSVALQIEVSGPIAMVVAGLVVGNHILPKLSTEISASLRTFWRSIDLLLNSLLFVSIGFIGVLVHPLAWAPMHIIIPCAILVCLVARAISVYVPIAVLSATPVLDAKRFGMTMLLTWGGLRGGLSLALALSLPKARRSH
jgi:CPA1 family monovalent cation:H+ antiporter